MAILGGRVVGASAGPVDRRASSRACLTNAISPHISLFYNFKKHKKIVEYTLIRFIKNKNSCLCFVYYTKV